MRCKVKSFAIQSVPLSERRDYERGSCVYRWRPPSSQLLIIKAFRRRYLLLNSRQQPGCSERKKHQGNNPLWIHWDSYLIAGWIDAATCGQSGPLIWAWLLTQLLFVGAGTTPILWASQEQKQLFKQCKITSSQFPRYSFFLFIFFYLCWRSACCQVCRYLFMLSLILLYRGARAHIVIL